LAHKKPLKPALPPKTSSYNLKKKPRKESSKRSPLLKAKVAASREARHLLNQKLQRSRSQKLASHRNQRSLNRAQTQSTVKVQRHRQRGNADAQPVQASAARRRKLKPPPLKKKQSRSQLLSSKNPSSTMLLICKIFNLTITRRMNSLTF